MLALVAALLLTSPAPKPEPAAPPPCHWYSKQLQMCRDEDVEVIGELDARPAPGDWPTTYYPVPREYGAYPLEQPRAAPAPPLTSWP